MIGSAIDLYSLEATLNLFETLSGDWVGGNRPFYSFRPSSVRCIVNFGWGVGHFFCLTETAKKAIAYHLSSVIHPHPCHGGAGQGATLITF